MTAMTPRERVSATLRGARTDRPPVSFWGHVYTHESSPADLVEATLRRQREYDWDWVKLNPRKHYHVEDWGVRYRYPGGSAKPALERWPIHAASDWSTIGPRPPDQGALGEQLEAVRLLRRRLSSDVPVVQTVFTPLAVLGEMAGRPDVLRRHLDSDPERVREALEAVTTTYEGFVRRLIDAGADGIYLATTSWASRDLLDPERHRVFSRPYDLRILRAAQGAPFHVLHVCKPRNLLFEVADYPVAAFSWDATDPTNPSLADGLARLSGAVMGGVSQERALLSSTPDAALGELRRGLDQTGGRRWMVAPGCSIPPDTPAPTLRAIRDAVGALAGRPAGAPPRVAPHL